MASATAEASGRGRGAPNLPPPLPFPASAVLLTPKLVATSHISRLLRGGAGKAAGIETFGFVSDEDDGAVATKCRRCRNRPSSEREQPSETQGGW